jgi:hypothetical protein
LPKPGFQGLPPRNNIKKFKNIPFVWENENYLLKMKSDTSSWLYESHFNRYFSFSSKNDPFLVFPSIKSQSGSTFAQGGGATSLKKIRGGRESIPRAASSKLTIPLQSQLMKIIRQSEVYLMEEAVTNQIIQTTQNQIEQTEKALKQTQLPAS